MIQNWVWNNNWKFCYLFSTPTISETALSWLKFELFSHKHAHQILTKVPVNGWTEPKWWLHSCTRQLKLCSDLNPQNMKWMRMTKWLNIYTTFCDWSGISSPIPQLPPFVLQLPVAGKLHAGFRDYIVRFGARAAIPDFLHCSHLWATNTLFNRTDLVQFTIWLMIMMMSFILSEIQLCKSLVLFSFSATPTKCWVH